MNYIALRMLIGDRAKYLGIIIGITFAALIMTQQPGIFVGIMMRTFSFVTDTGQPDIWVANSVTQYIDDIKPVQDTQLYRVKSVDGVKWAVPIFKGGVEAKILDGIPQNCTLIGLDDTTLIGGPPYILSGKLENLRKPDAVLVDCYSAVGKLAHRTTDGKKIPIKIGDELELNDHRVIVVGTFRPTQTLNSNPMIYTTYTRATSFAPHVREMLSYVAVKAADGQDHERLAQRIAKATGLSAYTKSDFKKLTFWYYMRYSAFPINFGISVLLGFLVGAAIAGQMFYNFTLDNLRYFGAMKAMGARDSTILKMILIQAISVGATGWGIGVGLAALFGFAVKGSIMAFNLPWWLLLFSGGGVALIVLFSALVSIRRVIALEPAVVFRS